MADYALLVGIDNYKNHAELRTPVNDVEAICDRLGRDFNRARRWTATALVGPRKSGKRVTDDLHAAELTRLLAAAAAEHGHFLYYFAGHGKLAGLDDNRLILQGDTAADADVSIDLHTVVLKILRTEGLRSATVILDACYAGGINEAPDFKLGRNRALLTSSRGVAEDGGGRHSPFADLVLESLDGVCAPLTGDVTVTSLFEYVSKRFGLGQQQVRLTINIGSEPVVLRQGPRLIDPGKLTDLFKESDSRITLTWAHEGPEHPDPTIEHCYCGGVGHHHGRPPHTGFEKTREQKEFDELKRLYMRGLIETQDDKTPYVLIQQGLDLWLSPLGRWYWHQSKRGLI